MPQNPESQRIGNYSHGLPKTYVQGLFEESSVKKHRLGTLRILDDGRMFRYAQVSAAAISAAGTLLSKVQTPVDGTIAAADAAIDLEGVRTISVTAAGITAGQLEDGYLVVKAGTDIGTMYKIRGCGATDGIASGRVQIELYDKLYQTWVAASTTVALHTNPYKSILINPAVADENATTAETVMGMSIRPITASYYCWVQTHGVAALTLDIDSAAGNESNEKLIVAGTTAGRGAIVIPLETTFFWNTQIIGYALEKVDLTDAEGNLVFLTIE